MKQRKFPIPAWSRERYESAIEKTKKDISELTSRIVRIDGQIAGLKEEKRQISYKQSKKARYLNLLEQNVKDNFTNPNQ